MINITTHSTDWITPSFESTVNKAQDVDLEDICNSDKKQMFFQLCDVQF